MTLLSFTGGILLLIHRMTATFGKLQNHTLELKGGLNILEAPNETGKSTWCAFLLSMLYGINSRERERAGFIPDKIRYAPWSGMPMSGRLDCTADGGDLTLTRSTRRPNAPMGEFQALYTGTGNPAPVDGSNCGEALLGVNREIFERSAFIRQSGLAISQDASLERRIAALITSGEEDVSYSEASDLLKRQLNRRRHNKTGQLPALEAELQELEQQRAQAEALAQQLADIQQEIETLSQQETVLMAELARHDHWEALEQQRALQAAQEAATQAEAHCSALRQQLTDHHIPESETIIRLRGAIVNLETTRKNVEKARAVRDEAAKALLRAEAALHETPFMGQTPEQVRRAVAEPPKGTANGLPIILGVYGTAAVLAAALYFLFPTLSYTFAMLAIGLPLMVLSSVLSALLVRRARRKSQTAILKKRFGTADPAEIAALADTYYKLYEAHESAQADLSGKSAAAETLYDTLFSNEQAILLEIRRFAPTAFDILTADALLRQCASHRKALAEAETAAARARMEYEILLKKTPPAPADASSAVNPPARARETVAAELADLRGRLDSLRSSADRLSGHLHACGDPMVLSSTADYLRRQIQSLEKEYEAIQLALSALDSANTTLQNRFSPELGRRTAEIFSRLTDGQYSSVVLDRTFRLSAEPQGDAIYRDAALLSAGTADQLYLAARLAICDLVLPEEKQVPLILDDALANFDDRRCESALRWLKEEAKHRQILLFTCHSREAAFFADDSEVLIQRLTEPARGV